MEQKQETKFAFAIWGTILAGFAGYVWGTMLTTRPFFGYDIGGAILGVAIAFALLALGEALKK